MLSWPRESVVAGSLTQRARTNIIEIGGIFIEIGGIFDATEDDR